MGTKKLLIFEDDMDLLELYTGFFERSGYEVFLSRIPLETDMICDIDPDIILMDIHLTDAHQGGELTCRELKADPRTSAYPVLMISGNNEGQKIALDCKADGFLAKPFHMEALLTAVSGLTGDKMLLPG